MKKFFTFIAAVLFAGSMMAGNALMVTFDFTTNTWGLPEGASSGASAAAQFNNGTYTITLAAADKYYFNTDGYLMLGKQNSTLTLPAFDWNTSKIVITGREAASGSTVQNIFVGDSAVSKATTGAKGANEYEIAADYQAAGNVYVLKVLSAHNTQITKIEVYSPCDTCAEPIVPVDSTEIYAIDFTQGQGDWTINDVEKDTLAYVWQQTEQYGMKASAYLDNANHATESWLISPALDLSNVEEATLSFSHARKFGELNQLSVKAKAGEGEWADLNVSAWPDGSSWSYLDATADLAAVAGKANVQIAFVYTSSNTNAATWEIKTVAVNKGAIPGPEPEKLDTVTVTEALAIAATLTPEKGKSAYTEKKYAVKGFVVGVSASKTNTYYMSDTLGAYGTFQAYQCKTIDKEVVVNDYVIVTGKIQHYYGEGSSGEFHSYEISSGDLIHAEAPQGIENIVLTEKAQKVVVDGVIYIVRDNKLFNLQGTQVR